MQFKYFFILFFNLSNPSLAMAPASIIKKLISKNFLLTQRSSLNKPQMHLSSVRFFGSLSPEDEQKFNQVNSYLPIITREKWEGFCDWEKQNAIAKMNAVQSNHLLRKIFTTDKHDLGKEKYSIERLKDNYAELMKQEKRPGFEYFKDNKFKKPQYQLSSYCVENLIHHTLLLMVVVGQDILNEILDYEIEKSSEALDFRTWDIDLVFPRILQQYNWIEKLHLLVDLTDENTTCSFLEKEYFKFRSFKDVLLCKFKKCVDDLD